MARRTATVYGGEPVVSAFEFDEAAAMADEILSIKQFAEPGEEWALFVMANRNREGKHPIHDYDIVSRTQINLVLLSTYSYILLRTIYSRSAELK